VFPSPTLGSSWAATAPEGYRDRYKKYNVLIGLTQMDTKSCKIPKYGTLRREIHAVRHR
jgi:hypothetical protein